MDGVPKLGVSWGGEGEGGSGGMKAISTVEMVDVGLKLRAHAG